MLLISCSEFERNDKQKTKNIDYPLDNKMTFINDTISKRWLKINEYSNFLPNNHDLKQIDLIFKNAIENGEFNFLKEPKFENVKKYYRQYVCFINGKGEKIVYINAFCLNLDTPTKINGKTKWKPFDWKNELLIVNDGGDCYWSIWINITKLEYYDLIVNGEA